MSLLEIHDLRKRYGTVDALKGISLAIERGEFFGLLGPNGAGKSTTINILLGLILADSGTIRIFEEDFATRQTAIRRRMNVAAAFTSLSGVLTVRENLKVYGGIYGVKNLKAKIDELLERFEITDLANRKLQYLSSGQHTRVTLCKGLINDPELLLLDECTLGLDPDIAEKTRRALQEFQREKLTTIIFTSHNMNEVEELCGRIAFLSKGEILRVDTAARIKSLIPQQILEVRFQSGEDLDAVRRLDGAFSPQHTGDAIFRFVLDEPETQLDAIMQRLMQTGARIADLQITRPTLEDVFIKVARGEIEC
ncbi:MAG: ABC transporter ATP-binding protein [Deltaproteobacteria bacterium]|nr:ABC transporter ATP-binding protein [Deltaproteobacteria bacterium]